MNEFKEYVNVDLISDVVTVRFIENYILCGNGGAIRAFDLLSLRIIFQHNIFAGQNIHDIIIGPHQLVCVIGGRLSCVFTLFYENDCPTIIEKCNWSAGDWIISVSWLEDGDKVVLLTANNSVSLWDWKTQEKLKVVMCEEKCIIYSGHLLGNYWSDLTVLVGTVFKEIVIWTPNNVTCNNNDSPVIHRLKGHSGVIFSVTYDAESQCLITTSDDRSVRMWFVDWRKNSWNKVDICLKYTMFGHMARVWRVVVVPNGIISVGEDSYLCAWNKDSELIKRWKVHQGGGIWSVDYSTKHRCLVTGGNDGGINLWPEDTWKTIDKLLIQLPPVIDDFPRRVIITTKSRIVAVTNRGSLICKTESCDCWKVFYYDNRLSDYCLLETSQCRSMISLATIDGTIFVFKEPEDNGEITHILTVSVVEGKIFSLHWLNPYTLLTCASHGRLELWKIEDKVPVLLKVQEFLLPKCKERWLTAALSYKDYIICGDRQGNLHLYNILTSENKIFLPRQSFHSLHGKLGVSCLAMHNGRICSAGRDRYLHHFHLSEDGKLNCIHSDKLPIEWIASIYSSSFGFYVLGFIETKFIMWDVNQNQAVFEVFCGGGHRSWDCMLQKQNSLTLVFIKNKTIHQCVTEVVSFLSHQLQPGFHHKTINFMKLCGPNMLPYPLLLSASDDTTIRITAVRESKKFQCLSVLHSHISGVRALAIHYCEKFGFVMFSAGCRAELKMWRLHVDNNNDCNKPEILCEEVATHRLRGFDKKRHSNCKLIVDPETRYMDLAVISLAADSLMLVASCSDGYIRFFFCDILKGVLVLYDSTDYHKRCILHLSTFSFGRRHILLTMPTDGYIAFFDVTSNVSSLLLERQICGNEMKFTQTRNWIPFSQVKVHQSGINCYDFINVNSDTFLFATGGDDNMVALTLFKMKLNDTGSISLKVISQFNDSTVHCTQVTGVKIEDDQMVTTGIDQRVAVWDLQVSYENCNAVCRSQYLSAISDIQGLELWKNIDCLYACVYGKGMEMVKIKKKDKKDHCSKVS